MQPMAFMLCPTCTLRQEDRQKRGGRTKIHIGNFRPNVAAIDTIKAEAEHTGETTLEDNAVLQIYTGID